MSHGPKITTNVLKKYILLMESARIRHDMGFWAAAPPRAGMENRTAAPGTACVMPAPHGGKIKAVEARATNQKPRAC
jgi:hypothetical protein